MSGLAREPSARAAVRRSSGRNTREGPAVVAVMMSRRAVLRAAALGAASVGTLACSGRARRTAATPATRDVAGLVELLEKQPRPGVLDSVAAEIRSGLNPVQLLTALMIAGSRTVLTRERFSKEQHSLVCPYAMHHAAALVTPSRRWEPLLWAVDYLKWAQQEAQQYDAGPMPPPSAAALPSSAGAAEELGRAVEAFEGERAEVALVALLRSGDRRRAIGALVRNGSRDFRHIGHKAIHVANALRTLNVIGWGRHCEVAEVVLRPVAWTLALHYDVPDRDLDGAWSRSRSASALLPTSWHQGAPSDAAITALLAMFRKGDQQAATDVVVEWLCRGAAPRSIWEAMLLSGAELLLTHPGAVEALHAVTASNAAYAAYLASAEDTDRRLLLLQNASRVAEFHDYAARSARRRNTAALEFAIEVLDAAPGASGDDALADISHTVRSGPEQTPRIARMALAYLSAGEARHQTLGRHALERAIDTTDDTHDFKLPVAALEDAARLSPQWRARYLAACTPAFRGAGEPRTELADRIDALTRDLE